MVGHTCAAAARRAVQLRAALVGLVHGVPGRALRVLLSSALVVGCKAERKRSKRRKRTGVSKLEVKCAAEA